jgi:hypothetical protein
MDQIANNVLTIPIEKNMIFIIYFYSHKLTFVSCFLSTHMFLGFFSTVMILKVVQQK